MADLEKTINDLERDRLLICGLNIKSISDHIGDALELLKEQQWIPVSEKLPEEHDTIFAKLKGTDKWNDAMCEKMSADVTVVCVLENGERVVSHSRTVDGEWDIEKKPIKRKVTHWMQPPKPPKDGEKE